MTSPRGAHSGGGRPAPASSGPDLLVVGYKVVMWWRFILLAHLLVVQFLRLSKAAHPAWVAAATLVIVAWTLIISRVHIRQRDWSARAMWLDLGFTLATIAVSPWMLGHQLRLDHMTVGGYWILAAPMTVAVWGGFFPGLIAGAVVGAASWCAFPTMSMAALAGDLAAPAAAAGIGFMMDGLRRAAADRDEEQRRVAALAERERLTRILHDGTLQVLALVEREGADLGERGQQLAQLARAQERKLRAVLQDRDAFPQDSQGVVDVTARLDALQDDQVTVSTMAGVLMLDTWRANELVLAVSELITNVRRHAGPGAHAWILLEQVGEDIVLSLRDNGRGMPPGRLEEAEREGRMGVSRSVVGRLAALGGSATMITHVSGGVEWVLKLPM